MDASDLKFFAAVARTGGMARAADELNTVQSNVTTRIRRLEEDLGQPLFDRHSRGVTLTAAGKRLLPYAARISDTLAEARRAVDDDGRPQGPLVIGSLETTTALRLSPRLAEFAALYPSVDLTLRTGTTRELIEGVLARRIEGAFVCGPVDHPELAETTVFNERLCFMTAPGVRDLDALLGSADLKAIVLRLGCSYRQRMEEILTRRGVVGVRFLEFGTLEAIVACVGAGLGITMLPKSLIGGVWPVGRVGVHDLPAAEAAVETVFIRRRDAYVSSALKAFLAGVDPAVRSAAE